MNRINFMEDSLYGWINHWTKKKPHDRTHGSSPLPAGTTQKKTRATKSLEWNVLTRHKVSFFQGCPNDTFLLIWLVLLVPLALFYTCYRVSKVLLLVSDRSMLDFFPSMKSWCFFIGRWSILTVMKYKLSQNRIFSLVSELGMGLRTKIEDCLYGWFCEENHSLK